MRMDKNGRAADEFLNNQSEKEISSIIYKYGEERFSKKIAKAITEYKKKKKIESTSELVEIIKSVKKSKKRFINPATKTFQAIRIYINDEIEELKKGLSIALNILIHGGRLAVISFHSLEDRLVKNFFNKHSGKIYNNSRYLPQLEPNNSIRTNISVITKKVVKPMANEIKLNSSSRSAKLRVAEKLWF